MNNIFISYRNNLKTDKNINYFNISTLLSYDYS